MSGKSFYDLDYIIEINEQRYEQYMSAYNELMGKLTNIVLIYSGVAIFLVPIVRSVFWGGDTNWIVGLSFGLFVLLFVISVFNTVRFLIPVTLVYPEIPKKYYTDSRDLYELSIDDRIAVEDLLKASYVYELERALVTNYELFCRKRNYYRDGIIYALLALLPYTICFFQHISNEWANKSEKTEIVKIKFINSKIL